MSVAPSAYLNASRSSSGMCLTACMASRFSVRLTGRPASRSSRMNPLSRSSMGSPTTVGSPAGGVAVSVPAGAGSRRDLAEGPPATALVVGQLLGRLGDVALVLQQDVEVAHGVGLVDRLDAEQHQRAGPVERL